MKTLKNYLTLTNIVYALCFLLMAWFIVSFIDINTHNMTDTTYKAWNFFTLIKK